MLEPAYLNQEKLKHLYSRQIVLDKNKYYFFEPFIEYDLKIDATDWTKIQYVSKDKNNEINWYYGATVIRIHNYINGIEILNLSDAPSLEGAIDYLRFIELLFLEKNFRKIVFYVVKDNPAINAYKRLILKNKIGRMVGILKKNVRLRDGKYHDQVIFEIYKQDFLKINRKYI